MDKLEITFDVITTENTHSYLNDIVESIRSQNIPENYEYLKYRQ